ncbi:protein mono-ADP-ribosyltransferase PARP14-like [Gigantopelta aegis]|uniref:protein mono-ADP-ribosyltransferase PARP14-like n=1 Tax=Gigantopelta aegis TaxID=1735272 RepID=UPI001B88BBBA|nr:protein mono-ADP-ribosyltransferase PARP14-like [Gigantopelta aegis]
MGRYRVSNLGNNCIMQTCLAKKIVEKPHKIDGCSLQVKLYIPPKPRPTYNDRLLITGLKSTTTKDCLINYLEAKTGCEIDESSVVYGEEEGTALIHFSEMPDVEKLQQVCAKRSLEGSKLTVNKVPISNSIIVKGLKPKTSEDTVWFYFEGKRSGNVAGVEVEMVQMKPDEGYSLVYFKDHTVVDQILDYGKGHKLDGAELNVSMYHECLGVGGGVCDPTWFKMPDPLQVKNLDKHKLKFIRDSETSRKALIKQLKHCHSELTWVTGDDSAVELKCSLTTEVPDARRLSRTWKTDAETALKEFLSLLEVEKIKVLKDIWDEVEKEIDAKHTEGASMFLYKDQSSIVVVGYAKFGKKMAEEVNSLVKKVEDDFERKKQTVSETINKVKLIQLRLLLASGFPKDTINKFPGLNVNIKIQKVEISFQGIVGDVKKAQVLMYESLQNTSYSKVQNFSQGQLQLADKKSVRDHIVKKMKSKSLVGVWETTPTEVTILAFSDSDAVEVAQMIKKSVIQNIHRLVPEAIILLSSDGWSKLTTELSNRYGEMIKIIPEPDNSQVVIIATDDIIAAAAEDVGNFFSENTIFEQTVKFPAGIQRFLQKHCDNDISKIASNLKSMQVQISYSHMSKEFTIKATKYGMDSSIKALQNLASKVDQKRYVHKKPGIRKLLLSQKGTQFIASLESNNKCIIEKTFDSSEQMTVGSQHVMESTAAAVEGVNVVAKCSMPGQRQLCFVAGDITQMKVDVIVNAANERLDHIGGLAKAIVDKGGDSIQRECSKYVSRHGHVQVGEVAISQPGNLPCQLIVHAVGPVWSGGKKGEEDSLGDAIINSLQETAKKNFTSIAIPALSCGIYNYPVPEATNEIVEAIKEYFKDFPASSVRVIYLTDTSINTVNFFIEAGKQVFGNRNMQMEDKSSLTSYGGTFRSSHVKPATAPKLSQSRRRSNAAGSSTTSSGVNIQLVKGEIAKEQADIIVNSTSNNLDLKNGAVSKSILTAAGDSLQKECRRNYSKGIQPGEIAVTSGGNLNCKKVFHTCLPNWSNDPTGKQLLSNLIFDCMKEASKTKCRSIAFPAMGTGNLGYPRDIVAKCMHDSINEFGNQNRNSSLRDVKIVVYDKDHATVKAFESELSKSSGPSSGKIDRKSRKFDGTSMDTEDSRQNEAGWHQVSQSDLSEGFKIGSVSLSVKQGDITKEKVDCIVNSTNDRLDFSQGGVSQAIARACGQRLKDECVKKVKKMAKNGVVSTGAEGLGCNAIVHVNISHFNDNWEKIISKCLSAAEDVPDVKSIAFPALGTGMAASSADNVAESFVTAINNHQKSNPSICDVRIIIFQPDMLQSFTDTIQKALGQKAGKPGFWHTVTDTVKGFIGYGSKHEETSRPSASDDSSEVPLYYFSDDYTSIDGCIQAVESYCRDETIKKVIADQALEHLNQSQIERIQNKTLYQQYVAKKKQISRQSSNQAERKLWHGTSADAISSVNTHGFNRSYCGKNATVHGDGVYFAVNASYSAHNTYSRPDAQGHKHLYYASVLTGDFTQGQRGMRVPPVKSTNQSQLYDSVVDNVNGPGMYIIFNDTQAYPDYLITFTI